MILNRFTKLSKTFGPNLFIYFYFFYSQKAQTESEYYCYQLTKTDLLVSIILPPIPKGLYDEIWINHKGSDYTKYLIQGVNMIRKKRHPYMIKGGNIFRNYHPKIRCKGGNMCLNVRKTSLRSYFVSILF